MVDEIFLLVVFTEKGIQVSSNKLVYISQITLALLLGSDYTPGVRKLGQVSSNRDGLL